MAEIRNNQPVKKVVPKVSPVPVTRVGESGGTAPITNWTTSTSATTRTTNPLGGSYDTSNNASTPTGLPVGTSKDVKDAVAGGTGSSIVESTDVPDADGNGVDDNANNPEYYFNPLTGKWEKKPVPNGKGGNKLPHENEEGYELDPATGTWIKKTVKKPEISAETRDAFQLLKLLFRSYDLEELADEIEGYMNEGLSSNAALLKLKTNPTGKYAERFAGNLARNKNGLNVVTEAEYLDLEKSYAQTLKSYGLGSMISTDKKQNWKKFATYIENDISALEFKDRIDTVQQRVVNADPATKELFKKWYPSITDSDLVSYFLNPKETIDKLKTKTTTAEIGAAFAGQNLMTSMESANELAKYGIDRAGALEGASSIADVLPVSQKLGDIYKETGIKYDQQAGVDEFLKSNAEAKRKRESLKSKERASFGGSAGVGKNAFSGPNI